MPVEPCRAAPYSVGIWHPGEAMSSLIHTRLFRRGRAGFGLVELLVTIAIAAILAAIALPSFREFMIRMNVTETTNELVGALNAARTEAVKRGVSVAVVADGSGWSGGWSIIPDSNGNTDFSDDAAIMTHPAVSASYTVVGVATGTGGSSTLAAFGPMGTLKLGTGFDLNVCRPANAADVSQSRWISVRGSGEIRSQRDVGSSPAGNCS
jgi:type IV fimbrial biogenesis protein FimT